MVKVDNFSFLVCEKEVQFEKYLLDYICQLVCVVVDSKSKFSRDYIFFNDGNIMIMVMLQVYLDIVIQYYF